MNGSYEKCLKALMDAADEASYMVSVIRTFPGATHDAPVGFDVDASPKVKQILCERVLSSGGRDVQALCVLAPHLLAWKCGGAEASTIIAACAVLGARAPATEAQDA